MPSSLPSCTSSVEKAFERREISKVLAIARVPESVFYEQFQSKEDLVSAFLKGRHASWMRRFENEIEARYEATGGGLELIADVLQEAFEDPKCFGSCLCRCHYPEWRLRQGPSRNRQRAEGTSEKVY